MACTEIENLVLIDQKKKDMVEFLLTLLTYEKLYYLKERDE